MNYHSNSKVQSKLMPEANFSQLIWDRVKSWPVSSYSRYKNTYHISIKLFQIRNIIDYIREREEFSPLYPSLLVLTVGLIIKLIQG